MDELTYFDPLDYIQVQFLLDSLRNQHLAILVLALDGGVRLLRDAGLKATQFGHLDLSLLSLRVFNINFDLLNEDSLVYVQTAQAFNVSLHPEWDCAQVMRGKLIFLVCLQQLLVIGAVPGEFPRY